MSIINVLMHVKDENGNLYDIQPTTTISNVSGLQTALDGKVNTVSGKGLSSNDFTDVEKNKLNGIETGANNYVHPTSSGNKHIPSGGSSGKILGWASDGTAQWVDDHNTEYSDATTSVHGLMSTSDKAKLNGIETGANKTIVDSALSSTSTNPVQNKIINSALGNKVDKVSGKGLSTNDFTNSYKAALDTDCVTPEMYGAVGDGVTNDYAAIVAAINSSASRIVFSKPNYKVVLASNQDGIALKSNKIIDLNNAIITVDGSARSSPYSVFYCNDISNVIIRGGTITGDKTANGSNANGNCHCLDIATSRNIKVENVVLKSGRADGILIEGLCDHIYIDKCTVDGCGRNGLSVIRGEYIFISNSHFCNTKGVTPQFGIDIEATGAETHLNNIYIYGCSFDGNEFGALQITTLAENDNVYVSNCKLGGCLNLSVLGTNSFIMVNNCTVKPKAGGQLTPTEVAYGICFGLNVSCCTGSKITCSDIVIDCSNNPFSLINWGSVNESFKHHNVKIRNLMAVNGEINRITRNVGENHTDSYIEVTLENVIVKDLQDAMFSGYSAGSNNVVELHGSYELASQIILPIAKDIYITTEAANIYYWYPVYGCKINVHNANSSEKTLTDRTFVNVNGTETQSITLPANSIVELEANPDTNKVYYRLL